VPSVTESPLTSTGKTRTPARGRPLSERSFFPALAGNLNYLDAAASTLVPSSVIEAVSSAYRDGLAGVHRGVHARASDATLKFEGARATIAQACGAQVDEIVLGRGVTEALNMLAHGLAATRLRAGDEVLVSELDHHANIVSWQLCAAKYGARVVLVPVDSHGVLHVNAVCMRIHSRTKVVALPHVANTTGAVLDTRQIAQMAHRHGALLVLDGAQAFRTLSVDVRELGCDAYVFGGHKAYGPNGVGVLVCSDALLTELPPLHGGGHMVQSVHACLPPTFARGLARHEAGTPNLEGVLGFTAAVAYRTEARGRGALAREQALTSELERGLRALPFVRVLGDPALRVGIVSFTLRDVHAHDVASFLDERGIAVRPGRMCAQPFFDRLDATDAVRVSLSVHSESADLDALFAALVAAHEFFA
jgi:cysteine desulfurase / selenocysteine lyase